eukprot:GHVN01024778.1.p1 GENE.GHVN01024778.1~~GHVN01024778.1.p1  ORF type:complete len:101 (+),score=15.47 GHVN01024778.1:1187-1489(+)
MLGQITEAPSWLSSGAMARRHRKNERRKLTEPVAVPVAIVGYSKANHWRVIRPDDQVMEWSNQVKEVNEVNEVNEMNEVNVWKLGGSSIFCISCPGVTYI